MREQQDARMPDPTGPEVRLDWQIRDRFGELCASSFYLRDASVMGEKVLDWLAKADFSDLGDEE